MKANQFSESISPMDLERLTQGSVWKDSDGEHGFVLAVTNRNVPKKARDRFPLSVVYTSSCNAESIFTIRVTEFLKSMTFVSEGFATAGFIQSMLSALKSHKELGVSPAPITAEEAFAETRAETEPETPAPVQILFTNEVPAATSDAVNVSLSSFIEKPYDNTLELTFENVAIEDLQAVFQHLVHIDTEEKVYPAREMQLVGVTQAYVRTGGAFTHLAAVTLALPPAPEGQELDIDDEAPAVPNDALDAALTAAGVPVEPTTQPAGVTLQA